MNITLLEKVLNLIEEKPEKWEQASWVDSRELTPGQLADMQAGKYEMCGTTACVAGWALLLSGQYEPELSPTGKYVISIREKATGLSLEQMDDGDDADSIYERLGAELLGLDHDQAYRIFLGMRYDSQLPKTFTDQVRFYLGLPPKHGTVFGESEVDIISPAKGEEHPWQESHLNKTTVDA